MQYQRLFSKKQWGYLTLLLVIGFFLGPLYAKDKSLSSRMRQLQSVVEDVLPLALKPGEFSSEKERRLFRQSLSKFKDFAHDLPSLDTATNRQVKGLDPSLKIFGENLESEISRALQQFEMGHERNSKRLVSEVINTCIACHTTSHQGPIFSDGSVERVTKGMEDFEQARFLTAVRHFDAAAKIYEQIIADASYAQSRPISWHDSIGHALAIAVRTYRDPEKAQRIVQQASKAAVKTAIFLKHDLEQWSQAIDEWKKEKDADPTTDKQAYEKMIELRASARKRLQYPADRSATVDYLRLTALGHVALGKFPRSPYTSKFMLLLAIGYQALDDFGIWGLHELYLESCVRSDPGSETAKRCFNHYEESVYTGYSGSGGLNLPDEERQKLGILAKLAYGK